MPRVSNEPPSSDREERAWQNLKKTPYKKEGLIEVLKDPLSPLRLGMPAQT